MFFPYLSWDSWVFTICQAIFPLTFLAPKHFLMQPGPLFLTEACQIWLLLQHVVFYPKTCNRSCPSFPPGLGSPGSGSEVGPELNDAAPRISAKTNWMSKQSYTSSRLTFWSASPKVPGSLGLSCLCWVLSEERALRIWHWGDQGWM